ncbi:MAG: S-layer homology domain-containing protein [Oscillospiraceae bacterium]|nr:S-layer homology domain-containing protein [Oscillospiraceae bacterium]
MIRSAITLLLMIILLTACGEIPNQDSTEPPAQNPSPSAQSETSTPDGAATAAPNDDSRYDPDKTTSRADAAELLAILFVEEEAATPATSSFTDVTASHSAFTYIEAVAQRGWMHGYDDGTFKPNDEMTFSQVVMLLVQVLGFEDIAEELGGYPEGYMIVANTLGITENVENTGDKAILYSTASEMFYNAFYEIGFYANREEIGDSFYYDDPDYVDHNDQNDAEN